MKLPNGERARVDVQRKLIGYCLNPQHRTGRHNARVFASALGITRKNAEILATALRCAARDNQAQVKGRSADATMYEIECPVIGPSESAIVRVGRNWRRSEFGQVNHAPDL